MKYTLLTILVSCLTITAIAQPPKVQWAKCYGGSNSDQAKSILQTADGGYITAGTTSSSDSEVTGFHGGLTDIWVVKTDDTGKISWARCYGGSATEYGYAIRPTKDGGYVIAGAVSSTDGDVSGVHGSNDMWVIKINASGSIQWQKCLGGSSDDGANAIQQTADGGYIVAGYATSTDGQVSGVHNDSSGIPSFDAWVVKLDDTGRIMWQKALGGAGRDFANSVQQAADGGYIVAGFTNSDDGDITKRYGTSSTRDAWVVKLSSTGSLSWQKSLGGTNDDVFNAVLTTADSGYILTGTTFSNDNDVSGIHLDTGTAVTSDLWVVKLDKSGSLSWQRCYGGVQDEAGNDIEPTADGNYIVCGSSNSDDGDVSGNHNYSKYVLEDFWALLINTSGDISWQKCAGGIYDDVANSITQASDGGFAMCGYNRSVDGDFHNYHGGTNDYGVVKLAKPLAVQDVNAGTHAISIFPNPSTGTFTLQYHLSANAAVVITDVAGKTVANISLPKGSTQAAINAAAWQPGIYFYKVLQNGSTLQSGKLLKQ